MNDPVILAALSRAQASLAELGDVRQNLADALDRALISVRSTVAGLELVAGRGKPGWDAESDTKEKSKADS